MNGFNLDLSFLRVLLDASIIVQCVMLVLVSASITSWAIIVAKRRTVNATRTASRDFETEFWSGGHLDQLYRKVEANKTPAQGTESIFEFGFREFTRLMKQPGIDPAQVVAPRPIEFTTRDGVTVHGFVTMPKGAAARPGAALTATAQAGAMVKEARASASDAGRLMWLLSSRLTAIPPSVIKKSLLLGPAAF